MFFDKFWLNLFTAVGTFFVIFALPVSLCIGLHFFNTGETVTFFEYSQTLEEERVGKIQASLVLAGNFRFFDVANNCGLEEGTSPRVFCCSCC